MYPRKVFRSPYNRLSNDMQACIDTGNREEADLTLKLAKEALRDNDITLQQMGDIQADYNSQF